MGKNVHPPPPEYRPNTHAHEAKLTYLYFLLPVALDLFSRQELAADPSVAPFICGAAVAEGPVGPGETWRGTLMVDETICPYPVYSVVSMLGEW